MTLLTLFFQGFLLGLGAAVPLGPINVLIMNEALRSYKNALAIGFGAMSADISYLLLIFYGVTNFLNHPTLLKFISIFGGVFLSYMAFIIFKGRFNTIEKRETTKQNAFTTSFLKGYILTLLNPYTILFWLSITSYSTTTESLSATLFGMVSALLLWIICMPLIIYSKRALISVRVSYYISLVSSFIILLFGISMLFKTLYN